MEASIQTPEAEPDNIVDLLAYRAAKRGLEGYEQSRFEAELIVQNERAHAARLVARLISVEFGGNPSVTTRIDRSLEAFFELEMMNATNPNGDGPSAA